MSDIALQIRHTHPLNDPKALCAALGLGASPKDRQNQARGWTVRCPVHGGLSCSVTRANDGTVRVKCFGCQFTGDALSLVAATRGLSTSTDFRAVLLEGAQLANLWDIVKELETGEKRERPPFVPPTRAAEPERDYPAADDVQALLSECTKPSDDAELVAWLKDRKIDPNRADGSESFFALPKDAELPRWAAYKGSSWTETGHRLIVPVYDADGVLRSVRAGRIVDGKTPKRLPPAGHKAAGLVMACALAIPMLRGTYSATRISIHEGEPDWIAASCMTGIIATVRLGITSGSWTKEFAAKIPTGVIVLVRTDTDDAGDRYAREIVESLEGRCEVRRKVVRDGQE